MNAKQRALVEGGFVGVAEAAKYLGISERGMRDLIYSNTISHSEHRGKCVVPVAALHAYASVRLKIGAVA
jgi:excisionase family DNA binding protein